MARVTRTEKRGRPTKRPVKLGRAGSATTPEPPAEPRPKKKAAAKKRKAKKADADG